MNLRTFAATSAALCIGAAALLPTLTSAQVLTSTETLFNFDLSEFSHGTPYTNIVFSAAFSSADPVTAGADTMLTKLYGGLNGTGLIQVRNDSAPGFAYDTAFSSSGTVYGPLETSNPMYDPMLNGIFSIGLQMTSGSAELVSFTACSVGSAYGGQCMTLPVPEPETYAMLLAGLGLVGAVARRRHPYGTRVAQP